MDPIQTLQILANFAIFIPPPWGEIVIALARVAPLLEEGVHVLEAINKADPALLPKIEKAISQQFGVSIPDIGIINKVIFAPHELLPEEKAIAEQRAIDFQAGH